ncbi:MAG: hypothetical protein JWN41_1608 [Thermoleophilia bacterium]|nr:hypothetical protein [Thermoleophilia bacterium]
MNVGTVTTPSAPVKSVDMHDPIFTYVTREDGGFWKPEQGQRIYASWRVGDQTGYGSVEDAVTAAKTFSQGEMPAVAIIKEGSRFALRGLDHMQRVMFGNHDTGVAKYWKFDDYDAAEALRLIVHTPAVVGLVDDSWNITVDPANPDIKLK